MYTVTQAREAGWGNRAHDFAAFMTSVDRKIRALCGLEHDDLADFDYASAFNDGMTPGETALAVLDDNGFPG